MTDGSVEVRRCAGLIEAEVDGELVGLHVENGTCYGFNPTATCVWRALEQPRTFDELCTALTAEFDVEEEQCRAELRDLLLDLSSDGLVEIRGDLG